MVNCVTKGGGVDEVSISLENEVRGLGIFVGTYAHSLDPKKRLTIPSEWRAQAGNPRSLYVLPDFHQKCLNVYPATQMVHKLEKLRRHSMSDKKAMEFAGILGASSDVVSWDTQGRIRIKDRLLAFAGISDQVILVGALDKFQVWSPHAQPDLERVDQEKLKEAGRYVDF